MSLYFVFLLFLAALGTWLVINASVTCVWSLVSDHFVHSNNITSSYRRNHLYCFFICEEYCPMDACNHIKVPGCIMSYTYDSFIKAWWQVHWTSQYWWLWGYFYHEGGNNAIGNVFDDHCNTMKASFEDVDDKANHIHVDFDAHESWNLYSQ